MKELYLVRHAKSSWKYDELADIERPLNKRGKRDAPFMGKLLKQQGVNPDLCISSPAVRAFSTAKTICEKLNYPFEELVVDTNLYMADTEDFLNIIHNLDESKKSVMLFSHNPGITDFANFLSDKTIDNIPTTGIAHFYCNGENWKSVNGKSCELRFFEYPKKYFKSKKD